MSLEGKSPEEIQALAALADDVLSKPDTASVFQRLVKKNNPDVSMPLVELEDKARVAFATQDKRLNEMQERINQGDAEKSATALYEGLRDSGTIRNKEDFNTLVTYASQNGFMTTSMGLKKAAMSLANESEAAEPTPSSAGYGSFSLVDDSQKDFLKNPTAAGRSAAAQAMDEIAKGRATKH